MRTTIDIDDDLLAAAKELARREKRTAGQVVSALLRRSLTGVGSQDDPLPTAGPHRRILGFEPFQARPGVITTNEMVNRIRDEEGI